MPEFPSEEWFDYRIESSANMFVDMRNFARTSQEFKEIANIEAYDYTYAFYLGEYADAINATDAYSVFSLYEGIGLTADEAMQKALLAEQSFATAHFAGENFLRRQSYQAFMIHDGLYGLIFTAQEVDPIVWKLSTGFDLMRLYAKHLRLDFILAQE